MKQMYNYKKALNQPVLIQRITKNVTLNRPYEVFDMFIFVLGFLLMFLVFAPISHLINAIIPAGWFVSYVIIPYFFVRFVKTVQPDGKNVFKYLLDYVSYLLTYRVGKKDIYKGEKIKRKEQ